MKPNITKTKHLLIGTHQKLRHANISSLELNLNGGSWLKGMNER